MLKGTLLRQELGGAKFVPRAGSLPRQALGKIARSTAHLPRLVCSVSMLTVMARLAVLERAEDWVNELADSILVLEPLAECLTPALPAKPPLPKPLRLREPAAILEAVPVEAPAPHKPREEMGAKPPKHAAAAEAPEKEVPFSAIDVVLTVLPPQKKRAYRARAPRAETEPAAPQEPRKLKVIRRRAEHAPKVIETTAEGEKASGDEE